MNEEEKKAVETLKDLASTIYYGDMNFIESDDLKIILNLIKKQQKELKKKDKIIRKLQIECQKKL